MKLKMHYFDGMSSSHFHLNCINNIMYLFFFFHFPYCMEVDLNQVFMWSNDYEETEMPFEKLALPLANLKWSLNTAKNLVSMCKGILC